MTSCAFGATSILIKKKKKTKKTFTCVIHEDLLCQLEKKSLKQLVFMIELREGSYQNKGYTQTMITDVITNTLARQNVATKNLTNTFW